ncbi:MAG: FecR domain-containing protein [Lunatimonas sp.]|uniref:FecR family protein n=1 Tax=Lunatimonas sp. TaxID=2060141 RepID=UPI00263B3E6F|nr:FecR family protein [Lunatimonas sp.]MCC5939218.1 FecR domain-containing protein [Lunatimonas sp.]
MKSQHIFELAKRFLSAKEDSLDKEAFEQLLAEFEKRGEEPDPSYIEQAKSKVLAEIYSRNKARMRNRRLFIGSLKFAASFILTVGVSYFIYLNLLSNSDEPNWVTKKTEIGMRSTISLSDGSVVRLNENSRLEFPEVFASNERVVRLYGEAYFDVVSNKERPFKVISDNTEVTVLGTTFNINTFQIPEITVASGSVKVADTLLKEHVVLSPGQQAVIGNEEIAVREVNPAFVIGWHTRKLQFNELPVLEVFRVLERAYGVTINFGSGSKHINCQITGKYEGERIETIMKGLTNILDFTYETDVSTKTITLTIQQCKQ